MAITLSAAVLLAALVFLLWRYAGVRGWHIALCALFGFFLASSSIGPHIAHLLGALARAASRVHF